MEHLKRKVAEKASKEQVMSSKMIVVNVRLYEPFHKFIEQYLAFFGSKQTVEELCRTMIYNDVNFLFRELEEFLSATFVKTCIEKDALFNKWPHLSITAFEPKGEEET